MTQHTQTVQVAAEDVAAKLNELDDEGRTLALRMIDSLADVELRRNDGREARWDAEREAMEARVGVTVQELADRLWDAHSRGRIASYEVAARGEQGDDYQTWRIEFNDGTSSGYVTFDEAIAAVDALDGEAGSADPYIMVALEEAKSAGLIDGYVHENVNGTAVYGLWVEHDGERMEHAGSNEAIRAALWGLFTAAVVEGDR